MSALGKLVATLGLEDAQFSQGLGRAEYRLREFQRSAEGAASGALRGFALQLASVAAAAITVDRAISAVTSSINALAKLNDTSSALGSTVEELSKLERVALETGFSFDSVVQAGTRLIGGLRGADEETKGAASALKALGIDAKDAAGNLRDPASLMQDVAKRLAQFRDDASKTAIALDLFGKSGAQMLPYLKDLAGAGEVAATTTAAHAKAADDLADQFSKLTTSSELWLRDLTTALMPALSEVMSAIIRLQAESRTLVERNEITEFARSAARGVADLVDAFATFGVRLRGLGEELRGVALYAKGMTDALASGLAATFGQWDDAKRLAAESRQRFAEGAEAFARATEYNTTRITKFGDALRQAQRDGELVTRSANGAFDDARDRMARAERQSLGYVGAVKAQAAALKEQADGFAQLAARIAERITQEEALASTGEKLTSGQAFALTVLRDVVTNEAKLSDEKRTQIGVMLTSLLTLEKENAARAEAAKRAEEIAAAYRRELDVRIAAYAKIEESIAAFNDANRAMMIEIETLGQTRLARDLHSLAIAKENALRQAQTQEQRDAIERQYAEREALLLTRDAREQAIEQMEREQDFMRSLADGASDFFERIFTSGRRAFDDLGRTVRQFFARLAAEFATKYVLGLEVRGGGAMGFLGQLFGGAGGGGNILGSLLSGGGLLASAGTALMGAGNWLGGALGSFLGSMGGGMAGGLGGVMAGLSGGLSGIMGGALASGLGQMLGAAIPVVGPLIAIASALGLFKDEKGFKWDNSLRNVAAAPRNVQQSALGAFAPSGDVDGKMLSALQPFIARVQALDDYIARNLLSEESLAAVRERIQALQNPRWWNLEDPQAIEKASLYFLQQRYGTAFEEINATIAANIRSWQGTADELLAYIDGFMALRRAIEQAREATAALAEALDSEVSEALDQAANSTLAAWRAQMREADRLAALTDTSTDALGQLVTGMAGFRSAAVQMLVQVRQVSQAVAEMFDGTRRTLLMSGLDNEGRYRFLEDESARLFAQLEASSDPLQIQRLAERINQNILDAFGLLSPEQQAAMRADQLARIDAVESAAQRRLNEIGGTVEQQLQRTLATLSDKLEAVARAQLDAAATQQGAANTFRDAADRGINVRTEFYADIPGTVTTRVDT